MTDLYNETYNDLEYWGAWARSDKGIGYTSPMQVIQERELGSTVPSLRITDDRAGDIDLIVSRLKQRSTADLHRVIELKFVGRKSLRSIGEAMKVHHSKANELLGRAVTCVMVLREQK